MQETPSTSRDASGIYYAPWEKSAERILTPFERFVHKQTAGSIFLIVATILALLLANSGFQALYYNATHVNLGFSIASFEIEKTLHHWVNDGLMALFFFVVGLELKREILVGELASLRKAALPIFAAIGGMVVPALIYFLFNPSGLAAKGWAIPMATDIAFAIGALVMLGNRVPRSLMAFLVALAIADDLGAVTVIALFYTDTLNFVALAAAGICTGFLVVFNFSGIRWAIPYFLVAVLLWFALLFSGIHATLAGIIGAMCVPARPKYDPRYFSTRSQELLDQFNKIYVTDSKIISNIPLKSLVEKLEEMVHSVMTPLQRLEHIWHGPVAFFVIPVFALFNAGVAISPKTFTDLTESKIIFGIIFGLVIGKLIGIFAASWLAVKLKVAQLPSNTGFSQIFGAALLAGIGFTMSIFIAQLAFGEHETMLNTAKSGILAASLVSGLSGYAWLWYVGKNKRYESGSTPLPG